MVSIVATFKTLDRFGKPQFIVSKKRPAEEKFIEGLQTIMTKINKFEFGTFKPLYISDELGYASIVFKFNDGRIKHFKEGSQYELNFETRKVDVKDKSYINFILKHSKHLKDPVLPDRGNVLEL